MKKKRPLLKTLLMVVAFAVCSIAIAAGTGSAGSKGVHSMEVEYLGTEVATSILVESKEYVVAVFQDVEQNDVLFIDASGLKDGKLASTTKLYVTTSYGTTEYEIHTSCSKPLAVGMVFGLFQIVGLDAYGGECVPGPYPPEYPEGPPGPPGPPGPSGDWTELEVRVQRLEMEQTVLERELAKLQADLMIRIQELKSEIRSALKDMQLQIDQIKCRIDAVESEAARDRQRLEEQIESVQQYSEQKVRSLQTEIERVERRAAEEITRLERYTRLVEEQAQQNVRRLEQQIAEIQFNIDRKVLSLESQLLSVRHEVAVATSRISALEQQVPALKEQVSTLKDRVSQLEMKVATLENKLAKLIAADP